MDSFAWDLSSSQIFLIQLALLFSVICSCVSIAIIFLHHVVCGTCVFSFIWRLIHLSNVCLFEYLLLVQVKLKLTACMAEEDHSVKILFKSVLQHSFCF